MQRASRTRLATTEAPSSLVLIVFSKRVDLDDVEIGRRLPSHFAEFNVERQLNSFDAGLSGPQ
ncbi:hypothetical protein SCAR479_13086 [Seiridium cardinale]|uniref:Uncharacterized protein n=1 Tax=Seiridium cardinale TaxID=138064 RepID=A0ABR2X8W3_9PEZI